MKKEKPEEVTGETTHRAYTSFHKSSLFFPSSYSQSPTSFPVCHIIPILIILFGIPILAPKDVNTQMLMYIYINDTGIP